LPTPPRYGILSDYCNTLKRERSLEFSVGEVPMRDCWVGFAVAVLGVTGGWRVRADQKTEPTADAKTDAVALVKRGDYLMNQVARCGDCHTPRTDSGELDLSRHLQGAPIWFTPKVKPKSWDDKAPDITSSGKAGTWGEEQMIKYLTTGLDSKGKKSKAPMPAYELGIEDARAMTAYLQSLAGVKKAAKQEAAHG
jgi:mono/diheme cytochrome c family protein